MTGGRFMQEEVTNKTVAFCVRSAKMTASVLQKVLMKYLQAQKQKSMTKKVAKKNELPQGRISVKELAKQNAGMSNIEITSKNIKSFDRVARKYGINFALKKDKSKVPSVYLVFFKGRDTDALNSAFREFTNKELKRAKRPTIQKRLAAYRDVVANRTQKVRNKQQDISR